MTDILEKIVLAIVLFLYFTMIIHTYIYVDKVQAVACMALTIAAFIHIKGEDVHKK